MTTALRAPLRMSALKAASCLKRFHEIYDLGLEDGSDESRRGAAFHLIVLEKYIPALVAVNKPADRSLLEVAFRQGIVASQCPPHLVDEVESLVFRFGDRFELDLDAFLESEARQVTASGHTWKPDLTYAWRNTPRGSVLRIEDLKTYYAILNEETIRADFQPQFYLRNAIQTWPGFDVYEFAMTFVRFGVTRVVEYTEEDFASLDRKVDAIVATIEDARARETWPAQPGEHCGFCRLTCDAADDDRVLDRRILNAEEAAIVMSRLLVTDHLRAADYKALKAWRMTDGAVRVNGMEYAHRPTPRIKFPARDVFKAIDTREAPDPPGLAFSKSSLSKLMTQKSARAWPGLQEDLEKLAQPTTGTRFAAKKVGDVAPEREAGDPFGDGKDFSAWADYEE